MTPADGDEPRTYPDGKPLPEQPPWRRDFPTDVPDDDHVARREFVKFLVLTSGAFAVGQCWIAAASARREKGPFKAADDLKQVPRRCHLLSRPG